MEAAIVNTVGRRVLAARERLGWTQIELGKKSGVAHGTISKIESGRTPTPSVKIMTMIASALGVTVSDLTGAPAELPPDVLENLTRLTGQDRQLLNEAVSAILAFPPDQRAEAIRFTVLSLQTMLRMRDR